MWAATWGAVTYWRQGTVKAAFKDENEIVIGIKKRSATLVV